MGDEEKSVWWIREEGGGREGSDEGGEGENVLYACIEVISVVNNKSLKNKYTYTSRAECSAFTRATDGI